MGRAATRAADSDQLNAHPDLTLQLGSYNYKLLTEKGSAVLSVSNGEERTSKNLEWAIGDGRFGQTFVYREQARYYESQLSFYPRLNGLGTTTGHMEPKTLETAAGGLITPIMIHQCFGCHSTASTTNSKFDPDGATHCWYGTIRVGANSILMTHTARPNTFLAFESENDYYDHNCGIARRRE